MKNFSKQWNFFKKQQNFENAEFLYERQWYF